MMASAQLQAFKPNTSHKKLVAAIQKDGACVINDAIGTETLARLEGDLADGLARAETGRDLFSGHKTKRMGALIARSPVSRELVLNPLILKTARVFLAPFCDKIQMHVTQVIEILPGQSAQFLHRDRHAWGTYLPAEIEPQLNTMWALTDFTKENGATHVIPGSHTWPMNNRGKRKQAIQAEMPRGSVLLFSGSVIHGGGANRTENSRIGVNLDYCLGWLRQEENQYLSCPPEIAKELPTEITELLGYTMGSNTLGYYSQPIMKEGVPDTLPPEEALGRSKSIWRWFA